MVRTGDDAIKGQSVNKLNKKPDERHNQDVLHYTNLLGLDTTAQVHSETAGYMLLADLKD